LRIARHPERPPLTAYVIVQLAAGQADAPLLGRPDVRALIATHGARVLAVPAGAGRAAALPSLTLAVGDMEGATRLAMALRAQAGVEAAYAKPGEAPP